MGMSYDEPAWWGVGGWWVGRGGWEWGGGDGCREWGSALGPHPNPHPNLTLTKARSCLQVLGVDRALGVAQHLLEHGQVDRVADGDGAVRGLGLERREVLLVRVRV